MSVKRKATYITPGRGYVSFPSGIRRSVRTHYRGRTFTPQRGRHTDRDTQEHKFHDLMVIDDTISSTGAVINSMNLIAQGVTESTRIGRKCTIRNIAWRFTVDIPEQDAVATPASGDVVRVILFLDKQANGAAIVPSDFLEIAHYQSFKNLANTSRFKTLMDRSYVLNYNSLASDNAAVVSQSNHFIEDTFFKKCRIPIEFSATAGAITEIRSNNIGVLLVSKAGSGGITSRMRLRFSDG